MTLKNDVSRSFQVAGTLSSLPPLGGVTVAQKTRLGIGGLAHAARLPHEGQRGLPLARAIAPTQKVFHVF